MNKVTINWDDLTSLGWDKVKEDIKNDFELVKKAIKEKTKFCSILSDYDKDNYPTSILVVSTLTQEEVDEIVVNTLSNQ